MTGSNTAADSGSSPAPRGARPLQVAALGYLLILLVVPLGGLDLAPDPIGWALVVLGVSGLPRALPRRSLVLGLGLLAFAVSLPLAVPGVVESVADVDLALSWAVSLPALVTTVALSRALTDAARDADDLVAAGWIAWLRTGAVLVAVLPALVFGAGITALASPTALLAQVVAAATVVVLLVYSGRAWARPGR